jgi:hypothetical protein
MSDCADQEFEGLSLGDKRRKRRAIKFVRALANHPGCSIPQSCGPWADTEGAYRLFDNEKIPPEAILTEHSKHTVARASQEPGVLVIADGSNLNFTGLVETEGLGYLSNTGNYGLDFMAVMVANYAGQPLGLIDAKFLARDPALKGKKKARHKRLTFEKESQLWLDSFISAQKRLPDDLPFLFIADAEADIFDLFALPRRQDAHLLVRASQDRRVEHPAHLLNDAIRSVKSSGQVEINLGRGNGRKERTAMLTIRFERLVVCAPAKALAPLSKSTEIYVVLAEEEHPPEGQTPVCWLLLTTLPIASFKDAKLCTKQYAQRWLIERFFYTLKSGCRIEDLQLGTAIQLIRAASLMSVVAWRLMWLMHESRLDPHAPCTGLFGNFEWKALYAFHYPTLPIPKKPPTLREAVRLTARLGGFLARKGDGEPGIKTIWLGMAVLYRLAQLYRSIAMNPSLGEFLDF